MWGAGLMIGPVVAGSAMALLGDVGLPLVAAAAYAILTIAALALPPIRASLKRLEGMDLRG
jgi:hypothetical protein